MRWRVYYDDGSYSDEEITQPYRVICVVQPRAKTGREVLSAFPYYLLRAGKWFPAEDLPSFVQQVLYYASDLEAACMGIWTDDENFQRIIDAAMTDPGLPVRSTNDWHPRR
jgi:hypothetical protein